MQGDLINRFRPCGAQARVRDGDRGDLRGNGIRSKADAAQLPNRKTVPHRRGLLFGEQCQFDFAGIVRFIPQGDAAFVGQKGAAVMPETLDRRVRPGQFGRDAVCCDAHILRGIFRTGQLLDAVKGGQIVPCALHRPDLVPPGRKGLLSIALHADVNEEWAAVFVDGDASGVVVIVAVAVGTEFTPQHPAAFPGREDAHTGVPDGVLFRLRQGAGKQFLFRKSREQPVPQVDVTAAVRVFQPVGVGIGAEVLEGQGAEGIAAHRFPEAILPRTVEVKGTQVLLNGKPLYFKGFCKHEDFTAHGRGFDPVLNVKDVNLIHWANANAVRTSHYPYAEEFYDLCDREGILVMDETPAVGIGGGAAVNPYKEYPLAEHHRQVLAEMIGRDKNHPCVVLWSLGNEPDLEHFPQDAYDYWHPLYELAHRLDPQSRPVTLVCCQNDYTKDLTTRTMDIVCINRYYGWYNLSGDLDAACYGLDRELDFWEAQHKPVMMSEYGADTLAGLHTAGAEMFSEEFQMEFYRRLDAEFDKRPWFVGEFVWNFADYDTVQGPMRVDGNKKGLFTRDRRPKLGAHFLRRRWADIPTFGFKK